jgi:glycosyltransferase involved in cell wall biosynthesis
VVDYRDSWLNSPSNYYPFPYYRYINSKKEIEVLRSADEVITCNRRIKEYIIESYHNIRHKDINIIPPGYDQQDFDASSSQLPRTNKMRFTHAGSFFDIISPKYFFEGLSIAINKRPEIKKKIEACFLGILSKENLHLISKYNLTEVIYNPGYVNHKECIKYLLSSDVLWLMIGRGDGEDVVSTVKMFEYFGARKPILACIPDGAAKSSLRHYNAAKICEPDNPVAISEMILEYYDLYSTNRLPQPNEEMILNFEVKKLTHQLVRYFEFLIDISPQSVFQEKKIITSNI